MTPTQSIAFDCAVLLNRALLNQGVWCFGADGLGSYGTSEFPVPYVITDIAVSIDTDTEGEHEGIFWLFLTPYSCHDHGHAVTDKNLELSVKKHLTAAVIDPSCVWYSSLSDQLEDAVAFRLDVKKLLNW